MRKIYLFSLLLLSISSVYSQKAISTLSLQLSFPQEEYQQTYDVTGFGFRWNVMHRPNVNIPISIGGEIGYLVNGSDSRSFDIYYLGIYDEYRVTAANNILSLAFKVRADLLSHDKPIQFFVEGTIGTNLFVSTVDISRETYFGESEYVGGNSTKGYWAFAWGPGAGIEIPVGRNKTSAISLKASYLFGSHTKYHTDPYIDNNGEVYFTKRESETTMLLVEGGVRFGIFGRRR